MLQLCHSCFFMERIIVETPTKDNNLCSFTYPVNCGIVRTRDNL